MDDDALLHRSRTCAVFRTEYGHHGRGCVIKRFDKSSILSCRAAHCVNREVAILQSLNHHSIVIMLLDCWQFEDHIYLAFNRHQRDLFHFSSPYGDGMPPRLVITIARVCFSALAHIHERGIYHFDVKPEHVVIDGDGTASQPLKASLISLGIVQRANNLDVEGRLTGRRGSLGFFAPEMLLARPYCQPSATRSRVAASCSDCSQDTLPSKRGGSLFTRPTRNMLVLVRRSARH